MSEAEKNSAQCAESRDDSRSESPARRVREDNNADAGADAADGSPTGQDDKPKITLDRYLSQRRSPVRAPVTQIASLLMMLIALIMIFVYKDHCGLLVADFFGGMDDNQQQQQQKAGPTEHPR